MNLKEFQDRIIEDAIVSAHSHYKDDPAKRAGFIAGVNSCRDKDQADLAAQLVAANTAQARAEEIRHPSAYEALCFRAGVEWVCDCMSAALKGNNLDPIIEPSQKAWIKAADVLASVGANVMVVKDEPPQPTLQ